MKKTFKKAPVSSIGYSIMSLAVGYALGQKTLGLDYQDYSYFSMLIGWVIMTIIWMLIISCEYFLSDSRDGNLESEIVTKPKIPDDFIEVVKTKKTL